MKKLVALMVALMMALGMMSFAVAEEAPFEITIMLPDFYADKEFIIEGNPVLEAIEKAANVKLDISWVPNSAYKDQTSLTLADPSNMPMIMVLQDPRGSVSIDSMRAGAFWDLTDYIPQYENLAAGSELSYNNISVDGRIYGIYRSRATARNGIYYRKDIAEKMGITEEPKTIEELTKLAHALADYDDKSYALNMCKYVDGTIKIFTIMHGAPNVWGVNADGNVYPAHEDPAFLEGLNWLRELYAYGGIDPDFMTIESGVWDDAERTSKAFMRSDCMDNGYRQQEWFENNEGVKDVIFALLPNVQNAAGETCMYPTTGFNGEVSITKAVKNEEDLKKCLSFLNWCNSAEGQTLLNYGLDQVTFWIREDGFRYTKPDDETDMSEYVYTIQHSLNQLGMNVNGDLTPKAAMTALRTEYNEFQNTLVPLCVANPCYPLYSETYNTFGTQLDQMLEDAHVQYIAGIIDEAGLRAEWQRWSDEGGAAMTQEFNEAYQATK